MALAFAVAAMLFIALPGIAAAAIHKLENANMVLVFGYLPLVVQNLTPYVLPIGFLLAVVSTYGRLAAENEWTAIMMAGVRPLKMFMPALVLALGLGAGMYGMVSEVLPTLKKEGEAVPDRGRAHLDPQSLTRAGAASSSVASPCTGFATASTSAKPSCASRGTKRIRPWACSPARCCCAWTGTSCGWRWKTPRPSARMPAPRSRRRVSSGSST